MSHQSRLPGGPGAVSSAPVKPPPSWWWFAGPVVLVLLAPVVFLVVLVTTVQDVTQVDARIPVDGQPHRVSVPTDGDRVLYAETDTGELPCQVTDARGRELVQSDYWGDLTMQRDGREWNALTTFDPADGAIVVTCTEQADWRSREVLVAPSLEVGSMVLRVTGMILVPMLLGGIGLLWGIVLAVVVLTRRTATVRP